MKCEELMLQGITNQAEIARKLKVAYNTAKSYMKIVIQRWLEYGTTIKRKMALGRQLRKSEKIQENLWELIKRIKKENPNQKIGALRTVIDSVKVENRLLGLDISTVRVKETDEEEPEFDAYEEWKKKWNRNKKKPH